MMQTEEQLNEQVLSLTKQSMFQTAADVIADWVWWDMIGRYNEPPVIAGDGSARSFTGEKVPKRKTDDREAGGSMLGQLQDRMNEEFGEDGWRA